MKALIHQIAVLWRSLYIVVGLAVLGGMPYLGDQSWSLFQEYQRAGIRLQEAKANRVKLEAKASKIQDYQKYAEEVKAFQTAIRDNRLDSGNWTSYEVAVKDRLSTVTDMRTLLSNAGPTSRYYFRPKRLEIVSLFSREHLPAELQKAMTSKENLKTPSPALVKFLGADGKLPVAGEKVLMSLSGTFLVFSRL
ncbi:MAG: hypothetical protein HQM00_08020 [Magnetococcales bacterium]|nr:hypothetical protein [Magnetococcales bacterium]